MTDPLAYALASLKRAAEKGYPWSVLPGEAAALVAEVERLRAEVDLLQQEARIRRTINEGLASERADVLAYIRRAITYPFPVPGVSGPEGYLTMLHDLIAAGTHEGYAKHDTLR